MWVSTGKAGRPKAWTITTLADLCPTPGRASNSSKVSGTAPPCLSTRTRDSPAIALDFWGARPQGRMISQISSAPSFVIFSGDLARAKSLGAT
jgi:hypothetical protein